MKTFLKAAFSIIALTVLIGFGAVQQARADSVTFSSVGQFNGGGNSISSGGITLTFVGVTDSTVTPPPGTQTSLASFGTFQTTGAGDTGSLAGNTFTLTITQSLPTVGGPVTYTSNLTGTVVTNGSNAFVVFNTTTAEINGVTYQIINSPVPIIGPAVNNGIGNGKSIIQGQVTVPEPTTMMLLGTGLAGLAGAARRRRMKLGS